jgi:hypothetical protein
VARGRRTEATRRERTKASEGACEDPRPAGGDQARLEPVPSLRRDVRAGGGKAGLPVEKRDELAEGAGADEVLALIGELQSSLPALSTHGDVIGELLGYDRACKKGSIWVLAVDGRDVKAETYLPPA